jgi:hypothetical protein
MDSKKGSEWKRDNKAWAAALQERKTEIGLIF